MEKIIKKSVTHQNIGGKVFIVDEAITNTLTNDEVFENAMMNGNWACRNFIDRRKDFNCNFKYKLYYGKVDGLGYIVAEDEFEDFEENNTASSEVKKLRSNIIDDMSSRYNKFLFDKITDALMELRSNKTDSEKIESTLKILESPFLDIKLDTPKTDIIGAEAMPDLNTELKELSVKINNIKAPEVLKEIADAMSNAIEDISIGIDFGKGSSSSGFMNGGNK